MERLQTAATGPEVQRAVVALLGPQCFSAGVVVGMGLDVLSSARDLVALAGTFFLADLYDLQQGDVSWWRFADPGVGPRLLTAKLVGAHYGPQLRQAAEERDTLVREVGAALRDPMGTFEGIADSVAKGYAKDWQDFNDGMRAGTLTGQFEAGRIFGRVLLDVLSLVATAAAVAKTAAKIATKVPRLLKYARRIKVPARTPRAPRVAGGGGAGGGSTGGGAAAGGAAGPRAVAETPRVNVAPTAAKSVTSGAKAAELARVSHGGIKPVRVLAGADDKVAVIGRSMKDAVEPYSNAVDKARVLPRGTPETFSGARISPAAQRQWQLLKKQYAPQQIPEDVVRTSQMFTENQKWAQSLKQQGYTVVDVGNPTGLTSSPFYEMEKAILFGDAPGGGPK